jgi:hypothetical protein
MTRYIEPQAGRLWRKPGQSRAGSSAFLASNSAGVTIPASRSSPSWRSTANTSSLADAGTAGCSDVQRDRSTRPRHVVTDRRGAVVRSVESCSDRAMITTELPPDPGSNSVVIMQIGPQPMCGYRWSVAATNVSLIDRALVHRRRFCGEPALSFVPLARPPPNGCCPTTAPVGLSFT